MKFLFKKTKKPLHYCKVLKSSSPLGENYKFDAMIAYLTIRKLSITLLIYIKDLIISLNKKNRKTTIPIVTSRLYFLRKFAIIILRFLNYYVKIKKMK
jgi:hypothetical protein